jgi:hypothetical protein
MICFLAQTFSSSLVLFFSDNSRIKKVIEQDAAAPENHL